ncbi:hypothetical protein DY000_02006916 [Brassica cretica]|nr:hypothetical protein DY000_02006916 [Brassica cretica]
MPYRQPPHSLLRLGNARTRKDSLSLLKDESFFLRISERSLSRISEQGPSSKKQERRRLRGAIGTSSLSASGTSPQEGMGEEKGSVKIQRGLERPPTSKDGNTCLWASHSNAQASSSGIIKAPSSVISKTPLGLGLLQGNRSSPGLRVWLRPERNPRKQDYWSDDLPRGSQLRIINSS